MAVTPSTLPTGRERRRRGLYARAFRLFVAVLIVFGYTPPRASAQPQDVGGSGLSPSQAAVVLVLDANARESEIHALHERYGLTLVEPLPQLGRAERVIVAAEQIPALLPALRSEPVVALVDDDSPVPAVEPQPDVPARPATGERTPAFTAQRNTNDAQIQAQWGHRQVNVPTAWDVTTGSPEIKVAVVDSGYYAAHPDRPRNLVIGPDFTGGNNSGVDPRGHGTHVAGIIAANADNGLGIAGVAPNVTVGVVRVVNNAGLSRPSDVAAGIRWAADNGYRVINVSIGGSSISAVVRDAVAYAQSRGALVVAAAGNCFNGCEGSALNYPNYPASYDGVLAVGATNERDQIAAFSNYRSPVGVAAPGAYILSTVAPSGNAVGSAGCTADRFYCHLDGTSMAAPHVSAVAALVWSVNPALTRGQVIDILKRTAVDLGQPATHQGAGRVDADAAVRAAQATLTALSTPTQSNPEAPTSAQRGAISLPNVVR